MAKPQFYLCLSCRFGDHAECRKGKCECECGSSIETASLSTRVMGVKRSKVVPAGSATGTRYAGLSRSGPAVRRRRALYTAAQLRLALEGRSAGQVSALDSLMGPEFLRRVEELQIQTQLIYAHFLRGKPVDQANLTTPLESETNSGFSFAGLGCLTTATLRGTESNCIRKY